MLVIAANTLSGESCGQPLTLDLSLGKNKSSTSSKVGSCLGLERCMQSEPSRHFCEGSG